MLFQRVNRTDAEKVFVVVYNASGGAFAAGECMVYDTTPTADGIRVTTAAAATLSAFAGIAASAIANGAYGLAQVYGYNSTASVLADITTALTAGKTLLPVASAATFSCAAASCVAGTGDKGFVVALQTNTTMTTPVAAAHKVFIRAL